MKKKIFIGLLTVLMTICLIGILSSCNKKSEISIDIVEVNPLPTVIPYQNFDVKTAFNAKDDIAYLFEGTYINSRGAEKEIQFDGSIMNIPQDDVVAEVKVTAIKGDKQVEKVIKLNVNGTPDVIDNGYKELWNEDSISKSINYDPQYVVDGNSSIKVSFGGYYLHYGTQVANLQGHLSTKEDGIYDTEYYSIYKEPDVTEAWKDAVMMFWVYYAAMPNGYTNADLEIGYRFATHHLKDDPDRIDLEFGDTKIMKCPLGQWELFAIRFKDLGQTTDLYKNVEDFYSTYAYENSFDMLSIKSRVAADGLTDGQIKYNYTFYLDGFDIMTYDQFTAEHPTYDFGVDYGDTLSGKFKVENWKTSGKGVAVDFHLEQPDGATSNTFSLIEVNAAGDWARISAIISIDFANDTTTAGKLIALGNGYYRYELMFADMPENFDEGEVPVGDETINMIYFNTYSNPMLINGVEVIDNYTAD